MALKIVRTTVDEGNQRPLRVWYAGRKDEALALITGAGAAEHAEDATRLVDLALAEDLAHARTLGAALASWDDDIAAYRILKGATEKLLDQNQKVGAGRWGPYALALCELALPTLARRPWEPVLLNYVGVALYGLGEGSNALATFEAAGRLDPSLENLAGNIAAAKERARTNPRVPLTPSVLARLRELRPALRRLGGNATRAVTPGRISLCMIVRDEEEMLPACLESAREGVDEMIIVDTGSTDRTVEIAESFGATVLHFAWTGSFSEARNHGLDAATGDYVLWLDADEQLEPGDAALLRKLAAQPWREAHWLVETNFTGQDEVGTAATHLALRLWRNRPAYRFRGAIHEQIRVAMPMELPERFQTTGLRIRHYGYLKSRIDSRDKHARNLELLMADLRREPQNAFTHFNIGTEYVGLGDLATARRHLEQSLQLLQREPAWWEIGYVPLLAVRLIGTRRETGDAAGADALAAELLQRFPAFTDLVFERALLARSRGDAAAARSLFEQCLEMGDAPARYAGMAGRGSFLALAGLAQLAVAGGDRARAIGLLERSLAEHPGYLPAGLELADRLLEEEGADPELVLARLGEFGHAELTWWLFLGTSLYEHGHAAVAETLFRRALAITPQHPAARVGLAEALLSQRRYADVEVERGELGVGTPAYVAMQRSRGLAAALAGDAAAAHDAAAAVALTGGEPEGAALRAVHAAINGAPSDDAMALAEAAAPLVLRLLDALARLEEFEAFERVVPVVEEAVGDPHEAALLLGELYLARGFYRLAGDAAFRAIDLGGEDARSLALLGKSAVAEGLFAEAIPVLEGVLALDPASDVRGLLVQVRQRAAA